MATRLVIAEDQRLIRELLSALLAREPELNVVGEAATGKEAVELTSRLRPDLLVLDIGLPDIDGAEVAGILKNALPAPKLLVLSVHSDKRHVRQLLEAGADGYVLKSSAFRDLVSGIRAVMEGNVYLSPDITREALASTEAVRALGSREQQVLALLAEGLRSSQIAARLHISIATVEAHRRNIMRKLGLHTIAELTKYAIRQGLTSL